MSISVCFLAKTGMVLGTDSRVTSRFPGLGETREDAYPKLVAFSGQAAAPPLAPGDPAGVSPAADPHALPNALPIAMTMVGAGFYAACDFRSLVHEAAVTYDGDGSVASVARAFADTAGPIARESGNETPMQVWVGGFSPRQAHGELYGVTLPSGEVEALRRPGERTMRWLGADDAVNTLWWGANSRVLRPILANAGLDREQVGEVMDALHKKAAWGPERLNWGMPLRSAVDLVAFLLDTQIAYERFMPGRGRCGPPRQVVAITPRGLHWIEQPFPW